MICKLTLAATLLPTIFAAIYAPEVPMGGRDAFHMDFLPIVTERVDPIISPGPAPAQHMHRIFGGNAFYHTYDETQFNQANCSSTQQQADKSAYWVPQLYALHTNGSVQAVPGTLKTYYGQSKQANETFKVFPRGFRMIVGSPTIHNASDIDSRSSFEWICTDNKYGNPDSVPFKRLKGKTFSDFDIACTSGLMHSVYFPTCWNGKDLWLPDSAHVTFHTNLPPNKNACPATHPIRIPRIHVEFFWRPAKIPLLLSESVQNKLVLASGDKTGLGWHVDFISNWDTGVLEQVYATCGGRGIINSGTCKALALTNDVNTSKKCKLLRPTLEEVTGPALDGEMLPSLPGCNPLWSGEDAQQPPCAQSPLQPQWSDQDVDSAPSKGEELLNAANTTVVVPRPKSQPIKQVSPTAKTSVNRSRNQVPPSKKEERAHSGITNA